MFSPTEVFSKKDAQQTQSKPTGEQPHFTTLQKPYPHMEAPPRIYRTPSEHLSPAEHLWRLPLYVKRVLKDLNYENFLFTVVARNLLTLINK